MPSYEYACKSCGEHVEVVQSFKDDPLTTCSTCGGPLRKVFGNIGIVFKGSGFYKTDSRSSSRKDGGEKRDTATTPSSTAAESKESVSAGKGDTTSTSTSTSASPTSGTAASTSPGGGGASISSGSSGGDGGSKGGAKSSQSKVAAAG
jgi:putative FmdB family regulatory protein